MTVAKNLMLLCLCAFPVGSLAVQLNSLNSNSHGMPSFAAFVQKHERTYTVGSKEYEMRQGLYDRSLQKVIQQNSQPDRLWDATINYLADYTDAEFSRLRGLRPIRSSSRSPGTVGAHRSGMFLAQMSNGSIPVNKSWDQLESLKADTDQGGCGSCWAIATVAMLNAHAEAYNHPRTWSAQELVDCTPNPNNCGGSGGCDGATVELGMNWVMAKGLDTEEGTPYWGMDDKCKKSPVGSKTKKSDDADAPQTDDNGAQQPVQELIEAPDKETAQAINEMAEAFPVSGLITKTKPITAYSRTVLDAMLAEGLHAAGKDSPALSLGLTGWTRLPENEYEPVMRAIAEVGPAAVSVDAEPWQMYGGGIFNGCGVDATINHAVLLHGYGMDWSNGKKVGYWHIKNSWGNSFGENGHIRMLREEGKVHCGTDYKPKDGTACDGDPATVPVCGMCGILYDNVVPHFVKK